jgi:thiamine transporter
MNQTFKTRRIAVSAVMLALSTVIAIVCALIPFLNFPFGGGITIASMLPVIVISYMYGIKWGFFTSFAYAMIQVIMDLCLGTGGSTIMALFLPSSEDYMGIVAAISILFIDYLIAYTVLGIGGIFRNRIKNKALALCLGVILALMLRYVCHIVSGFIFYGAWAEWFFSLDVIPFGKAILEAVSGKALALLYSVVYNGCYMIPEIIITPIAAIVISNIKYVKKEI